MTRDEHLYTIAGEEGVEVAQRCSKALRFGGSEVQPGQTMDNRARCGTLLAAPSASASPLMTLKAELLDRVECIRRHFTHLSTELAALAIDPRTSHWHAE